MLSPTSPASSLGTLIRATSSVCEGLVFKDAPEKNALKYAERGRASKGVLVLAAALTVCGVIPGFIFMVAYEVYQRCFNEPEKIKEQAQIACGVLSGKVETSPTSDEKLLKVKFSSNDEVTYREKNGKLFLRINNGQEVEHPSISSIQGLKDFYAEDMQQYPELYDQTLQNNPDLEDLIKKARLHLTLLGQIGPHLGIEVVSKIKELYKLSDDNINAAFDCLYPNGTEQIEGVKLLNTARVISDAKQSHGLSDENIHAAIAFLPDRDATDKQFLHLARLHGVLSKIGDADTVANVDLNYFRDTYLLADTYEKKLDEFEKEHNVKIPEDKLEEISTLSRAVTKSNRVQYTQFLAEHEGLSETINSLTKENHKQLHIICLAAGKFDTAPLTLEAIEELKILTTELKLNVSEKELVSFSRLFTCSNLLQDYENYLDQNGLAALKGVPYVDGDMDGLLVLQRGRVSIETLRQLPKLLQEDIQVLFAIEYEKGKSDTPTRGEVNSAIFDLVHHTYRPGDDYHHNQDKPYFDQSLFNDSEKELLKKLNGDVLALATSFDRIRYWTDQTNITTFNMVNSLVNYALNQRYVDPEYANDEAMSFDLVTKPNADKLFLNIGIYTDYIENKQEMDNVFGKVHQQFGTLNGRGSTGSRNSLLMCQ